MREAECKEKKDEKKIQAQGQSQLTYDPNNPDPFRRRRQISIPSGIQPKKDDRVIK